MIFFSPQATRVKHRARGIIGKWLALWTIFLPNSLTKIIKIEFIDHWKFKKFSSFDSPKGSVTLCVVASRRLCNRSC